MAKFKRIDRISEQIKKELSEVIRNLKDPRIPLMTSVVAVDVTGDLRYAKAYISVMGDEETKREALNGLRSAAGYIRREIGSRVQLRTTPEFSFEADNSIEHGAHINELLHRVIGPERGEAEGGDE